MNGNREEKEIKKRPTKGDKKAKRKYNRYRHGGRKGQRKLENKNL